jgi:polyribonucleotide nucleotidyltransferase
LKAEAYNKLQDAKTQKLKQDRAEKVRELKKSLIEKYFPAGAETTADGLTKAQFSEAFHDLEERVVRDQILAAVVSTVVLRRICELSHHALASAASSRFSAVYSRGNSVSGNGDSGNNSRSAEVRRSLR